MLKIELKENLFHNFRNYFKGEIINIENENDLPKVSYKILENYENKMINNNNYLRKNKKNKK